MKYNIYYHDKLVSVEFGISDMYYFIKTRGFEIIDDIEHLEDNYINVYCI